MKHFKRSKFPKNLSPFKPFAWAHNLFHNPRNRIKALLSSFSVLVGLFSFSIGFSGIVQTQARAFAMDISHYAVKQNANRVFLKTPFFSPKESFNETIDSINKYGYRLNALNSSQALSFYEFQTSFRTTATVNGVSREINSLDWASYDQEHYDGEWFGGVAVNKMFSSVYFPPYTDGVTCNAVLSDQLGFSFLDDENAVAKKLEDLIGQTILLDFGIEHISLRISNFFIAGEGFGQDINTFVSNAVVFDFPKSALAHKECFQFSKYLFTQNDYTIIKKDTLFVESLGVGGYDVASSYRTPDQVFQYQKNSSVLVPSNISLHIALYSTGAILLIAPFLLFRHKPQIYDIFTLYFVELSILLVLSIPIFLVASFLNNGFYFYFLYYSFPLSLLVYILWMVTLILTIWREIRNA